MIARAAGAIDDGNFDRIDHEPLVVLVEPVRQHHGAGHHLELQLFEAAGVTVRGERTLDVENVGRVPRAVYDDQIRRVATLGRCLAVELHAVKGRPVVPGDGFERRLDQRKLERLRQDNDVGVGFRQTLDRLLEQLAFAERDGAHERGDMNVVAEDFVVDRFAVGDRRNGTIDQQIEIGFDLREANDVRMAAQRRRLADAVSADTE
ncbi:hypothetical protein D3C80_1148760 [compost metagenome]